MNRRRCALLGNLKAEARDRTDGGKPAVGAGAIAYPDRRPRDETVLVELVQSVTDGLWFLARQDGSSDERRKGEADAVQQGEDRVVGVVEPRKLLAGGLVLEGPDLVDAIDEGEFAQALGCGSAVDGSIALVELSPDDAQDRALVVFSHRGGLDSLHFRRCA